MVTITLIIAVLVAVGIWIRMDFRIRYWRERAELYEELYDNERDTRIDYELELGNVQTQLTDSRAAVSRLIGHNAKMWASEAAQRVH